MQEEYSSSDVLYVFFLGGIQTEVVVRGIVFKGEITFLKFLVMAVILLAPKWQFFMDHCDCLS